MSFSTSSISPRMNHPQILPECHADTLLVELLGFDPQHIFGIGQVLITLPRSFANRMAVGIIDNDKRKPPDIAQFEIETTVAGIERRKKADTKHTLLVITPAFEDWVFENARAVYIDPAKYGFRTRKYFRDACKKVDAGANQQLKQFLNALKQKGAPGFNQLKTWICEGAGIDETDI